MYDAENSDDDYDDTTEEKHVDETRNLLWHIILENVSCNTSACMNAILELSDPSIFMMLGVSNVKMVNDLIFLDYLTDGNNAFTYMVQVFQQFAYKRKQPDCAQHLQLPMDMDSEEYWRNLISNAGDKLHPTDVFTFFSYHISRNNSFAYPSIHQELYINSIFVCRCISSFLLQNATVLPCAASQPFCVEFQTQIPRFLIDYMRNRFDTVLQDIEWEGSRPNFKWKDRHLFLNVTQVEELAAIVKYGLGNRSMGKAVINVDRGYRYQPGQRPWFHYIDGSDYSDQPVLKHSWRVKYLSAEFLQNYFDKAMGSTFIRRDQEEFLKRQNFTNPATYSIPQFILNGRMGTFRQSSSRDVWKNPSFICKRICKASRSMEIQFRSTC